jgi:hypothetical protein
MSGFIKTLLFTSLLLISAAKAEIPSVVINEIHYNPDVKTELVEFVELYNAGTTDVYLAGWYFSNGISYTFPAGSRLPRNGYLVVVQDRTGAVNTVTVANKYSISSSLIYGPFEGKLNNEGEEIRLCTADGQEVDRVDYQLGFPWPTVGDSVPQGTAGNGHSIQLLNPSLDNDLGGSWRSAYPTPGARNTAVYAANIPPQIRQVNHSPQQPKSNEVVTITAKVTDADGVAEVTLLYQLIDPGNYIRITDSAYQTNWTSIAMRDDGLAGDEIAGDDIYTAQLPASLQRHRRLVRYRIRVMDNTSRSLVVPYDDDHQPNFAYFVYDGVPPWTGNGVTYSAEVMSSLPIFHVISRGSDISSCHHDYIPFGQETDFIYPATVVYDGEVYDHVLYRIKGYYSYMIEGKKKWKFNFHRGHRLQMRDDYGNKYNEKWDQINLSTGTCPYWQEFGWDEGVDGMVINEATAFRFFSLSGVPACNTAFLHVRVIDNSSENGADQYSGDFWGLYIGVEEVDIRFINERNLPDGNLYKRAGDNVGVNQGPTDPDTASHTDADNLIRTIDSHPSLPWWESNVNLLCYYGYHTASIVLNNSDQTWNRNSYIYHNPVTNKWSMLPWDVDLVYEYATHYTNNENFRYVLEHSEANIDFKNRARELQDLLFNGEQASQLIDEIASIVSSPTTTRKFIEANQARWEYDPYVVSRNRDGLFYISSWWAPDHDFPAVIQYMKDYISPAGVGSSYGGGKLTVDIRDSDIPNKPTITYTGSTGYPLNDLTFETSSFSDPQGSNTFAAMKWRIAEVEPGSQYVPTVTPSDNMITLIGPESPDWKYFKGNNGEPSNPVNAWRNLNFNDGSWYQGQTSIGYGDSDDNTVLNDMQNRYSTIYLRHKFNVSNIGEIGTLILGVYVDDGCIVWINGTQVARLHVSDGYKTYNSFANDHEAEWEQVTLPTPYNYIVEGENIIAVQAINSSLTSSDFSIDAVVTAVRKQGTEKPDNPPNPSSNTFTYRDGQGKYEIDTLWESEELTNFNNTMTIPADAVQPGHTYRVRCRMKDNTNRWSHWSDPVQFIADEPLPANIVNDLRITEVMYNPGMAVGGPTDNDECEFIELKNTGDGLLDLTYVSFSAGINFDFASSSITSLAPGDFVLVVKNTTDFENFYGRDVSDKIAGEYSGKLANEGEIISLVDTWNGTIAEFEFSDGRGWPQSADGTGHSLVPLESAIPGEPEGSLNYSGNWRASTYIGGSPGQDDPEPIVDVVLNEIMAHTDYSNLLLPQYDSNDWIELYNMTNTDINLADWYLSDDITNLKKWAIPAVLIEGHDYISFDEVTGFHNPIESGFGLNKAGEQVILSYLPGTPQDRVADYISFKGQENYISLGRFPDGGKYWSKMFPSPNAANTQPILDIVIDELMYHPIDGDEEYIELHNPTTSGIYMINDQGSWRLDGAVSYTFPLGISISAGGRLIVVGFDPYVETTRLNNFIASYNTGPLTAGVDIVGPWSGNLSNDSERLSLEKPQEPDLIDDSISWIIMDEVIYADVPPWPKAADGQGDALQRIYVDQSTVTGSGNDPNYWIAASPSPGR